LFKAFYAFAYQLLRPLCISVSGRFELGLNPALFASVDAYRVRLAGFSDAQQERKIPVPYNERAGARLFKEENEYEIFAPP
jgi:hypothetical protein